VKTIFRVVTYNVHEGIGRDRVCSFNRISNVLHEINADIIALQEVNSISKKVHGKGSFLFEHLNNSLTHRGAKGITMFRSGSDYGNSTFVRKKADKILRHDISVSGREPRGILECVTKLGNYPIHIFNTHLGLKKWERAQQMNMITKILQRQANVPVILCGDFNEWIPCTPLFDDLYKFLNVVPAKQTFPSHCPLFKLDRIFFSPNFSLVDYYVYRSKLGRTASDHRPVVAEFSFHD
jgi:endonuclease/exonuclease/phosphatase family metal-dependent hydrolase